MDWWIMEYWSVGVMEDNTFVKQTRIHVREYVTHTSSFVLLKGTNFNLNFFLLRLMKENL
ncbi:MAG: hypothetical protein D6813_10580 [Calditrichaeota bacterium]|nr:MAG: hypothetical protein D6813_10580 [Calditrichota bacterium]